MTGQAVEPAALIERLRSSIVDRDLEGLVGCFTEDYRNETPVHPERGFTGRAQVRKNWAQIFAAIPDISADVVRMVVDGESIWTEWEHRGTRPDGSAHLMRGIVIFGVERGGFAWARFYLEPVESGVDGVDEAVRRQVRPEVEA
jgi:ketosteroid isomerase-like protein